MEASISPYPPHLRLQQRRLLRQRQRPQQRRLRQRPLVFRSGNNLQRNRVTLARGTTERGRGVWACLGKPLPQLTERE